jgi:hypothetical protein
VVAVIAAIAGGVAVAGAAFSDRTNLPDSDSSIAYELLAQQGGVDAVSAKFDALPPGHSLPAR